MTESSDLRRASTFGPANADDAIKRITRNNPALVRPPEPVPCCAVHVVDDARWADMAPRISDGELVPCAVACDLELCDGDVLVARLERSDARAPTYGRWLPAEAFGRFLDSSPFDDDLTASSDPPDDHLEIAKRQVAEMRRHRPKELTGRLQFERPDIAFDQQEISRYRGFGVSADTIRALGYTVTPGKRSEPVCGRSMALDAEAARRIEAEKAAAAKRLADFAYEHTPAPTTLASLGCDAIRIPVGDPGCALPREMGQAATFDGDGALLAVWRSVPGLSVRAGTAFAGLSACSDDTVIRASRKALDTIRWPDEAIVAFLDRVIRRWVPGDYGAIPQSAFVKNGNFDAVRAFAETWIGYLFTIRQGMGWVPAWMCSAVVRGHLVDPGHASAILWSMLRQLSARGPVGMVPSASHAITAAPMVSLRAPSQGVEGATPLDGISLVASTMKPMDVEPEGYRGATNREQLELLCDDAAAGKGLAIQPGALLSSHHKNGKAKANGTSLQIREP
jgi:hypothetical protein